MTTYGRAIMVKQSDPQKAQRRMRVDTNNGQQTFVVHPNWRTAKMAHFRKFPKQRNQWDRSPYYGDLDPRIAGTPQEHRHLHPVGVPMALRMQHLEVGRSCKDADHPPATASRYLATAQSTARPGSK